MKKPSTAIVHYTAPPVVGGVEAVIQAHVETFALAGYPATVVAGRGEEEAFAGGADLVHVPLIDSQHPRIQEMSSQLEIGEIPPDFDDAVNELLGLLASTLQPFDNVIVHNIFTKHFNLPLTAALHTLLDAGEIGHCLAWCHDFTWTSPNSRSQVHPGYPWDLLRTYRADVTYVVVSQRRQEMLAGLFDCSPEELHVIYNGVSPQTLLALSEQGVGLARRLGLLESDLNLLMPVRVTKAKNIEYALRVVAVLKERGCRPRLVLTGPPDPHDAESLAYFRSLQSMRDRLGLEQEMRFVYESGPDPDEPLTIEMDVVGDLFRLCDVMFMPSHREGFGMPVLEAGLVGIPVVSTPVPAAEEIGQDDVTVFEADRPPAQVAERILRLVEENPVHRFRQRVRQDYSWRAIFERDIRPLLERGK